jgi:hypothetical protein
VRLLRPTRWPVRARLTVLYAGTFLAAGVLLIAATYWLVEQSMDHSLGGSQRLHDDVTHGQLVGDHTVGDRDALAAAHDAVET